MNLQFIRLLIIIQKLIGNDHCSCIAGVILSEYLNGSTVGEDVGRVLELIIL